MDCIRVTHPCAGRRQRYCYLPAAPRLACVRPVASVHPEPGSNSSLYSFLFLYYTFEASPDRIDFFLSSFLYYTCFFNSFNELGKKFPGAYPVSSFAVAKLIYFPTPLQIFLPLFMLYNMKIIQYPYFQLSICKKISRIDAFKQIIPDS